MSTLANYRDHAAPTELITALHAARGAGGDTFAATLHEHGLRPLHGGRNNDVFAWSGPDTPICVKLYKRTDRRRVQREWHGLAHAASLGCTPEPLWLDDDPDQPALGMPLLPGSPILDVLDPAAAIKSLAEATRAMQNIPLTAPLATLERVDSIDHYIARLTDTWPGQLHDATDDPQTADMLSLLRRWEDSGDAELLAEPTTRVYSRGDGNLLNWLSDSENTFVVDFEFSGYSDVAVDAADHIEHISARAIPDHVWTSAEADLGVTPANRARFDAAQRTIALRWFFCEHVGCSKRTFVEQIPQLTSRYARCSLGLARMLAAVGLALAGRAGARLGAPLGLPASRSTLLRLVEGLPDPQVGAVAVLGVDDFALRRGHVYGTVLIDMDTHRPIDLLPDREAATFADWLRAHAGVQVADRWHLWHNLAEHVEKAAARHRSCWAHPVDTRPSDEACDLPDLQQLAEQAAVARREESVLASRTRDRYAAVQALRVQGKGIKAIMRELGLAKETVRRFTRPTSVEDLLATTRDGRASVLDEFKPYLHERFNAGHTNGSQLFAEIRKQGYRGSLGTVLGYLRPFRALAAAPPAVPAPPTVRAVTSAILRHPDSLDADEQLTLKEARARCPHLDAVAEHVSGFAEMMVGRHGERLDTWIAKVEAEDLPDLHRFANGLRRDHAAVLNGLTLPHSSGAVEGLGEPDQDDQAADVRQGRLQAAPQASPTRALTRHTLPGVETITKCGPDPAFSRR